MPPARPAARPRPAAAALRARCAAAQGWSPPAGCRRAGLPVQFTLLPQTGRGGEPVEQDVAQRLGAGVAVIDLMAGSSPATTVPRNTASTSPLTDRNAAFGLSASRRAASSGDAPG